MLRRPPDWLLANIPRAKSALLLPNSQQLSPQTAHAELPGSAAQPQGHEAQRDKIKWEHGEEQPRKHLMDHYSSFWGAGEGRSNEPPRAPF